MSQTSNTSLPTVAVVLAAGQGTRMRSALPKVLHPVAGRPLLDWVIRSARDAGCRKVLLVVGHQSERVLASATSADLGVEIDSVVQAERRGTGDALARAVAHLEEPARLLVLSGDVPLVRGETLAALLRDAGDGWALAVADLEEPGSLGRVVAETGTRLSRIVEAGDATQEELTIRSVNAGIYVAPSAEIEPRLARLEAGNSQGELYLTDAFTAAAADGAGVELFTLKDPDEALGVNDRTDLARVHRVLLDRKCEELMADGVTILEPGRTVVEADVEVGPESVIHPGVSLLGKTRVGAGSTIQANAWIRDSALGEGVEIAAMTVIEEAEVGDGSAVGPYARLRPGAHVGRMNRIGNFVEIKKSRLGTGVKAGHLSYLGDAEIGDGANIGAGTVTCNYDGVNKHKTEIGAGAFVGSDTMLVAPVRLGEGATTAAGSVITAEVPDGALGVGRARQKNLAGWSDRKKKRESKK